MTVPYLKTPGILEPIPENRWAGSGSVKNNSNRFSWQNNKHGHDLIKIKMNGAYSF